MFLNFFRFKKKPKPDQKIGQNGPKNKELSGDCRTPRHTRALASMVLVRTYDLLSGKIEAECGREGYPLSFGPSKVVTFGEKMSFFLVYLRNGAK